MKDLTPRQNKVLTIVDKQMRASPELTARQALKMLNVSPSVYYAAKKKMLALESKTQTKVKRAYKKKLYQAIPVESPTKSNKNVVMVMGSVDDIRAFLRDQI